MRESGVLGSILLFLSLLGAPAFAIDFETVPGVGSSVDQMQISTQYWFANGVRFSLEEGGFPSWPGGARR